MPRSRSSKRWLKEHFDDPYVKKAQDAGYRSRAVYKLIELQKRDHLFKPGMLIVDLGAAPGGWSEIVAKLVGPKGEIIAVDILPMEPLHGVHVITGDFSADETLQTLLDYLNQKPVDLVMSDMAPNISGIATVDQSRSMYLAEQALCFAQRVLKPNGCFLVKVFQGEGFDHFYQVLRDTFSAVKVRKPRASRSRSTEVYLLALGLQKQIG